MSALVMPNQYSWQLQARPWSFHPMTNNTYPPPPQPDGQHYNALYPTSNGAQQLMDHVQQPSLQYGNLAQQLYPKVDAGTPHSNDANHHMHTLAQELQQRAALGEQRRQQLQQDVQQIHSQAGPAGHSLPAGQPLQHQAHLDGQDQTQKANRLRKACDSCSIRKVKCDEHSPCKACAALDIPCTFERPSRRRGPPNRHAEAIKRRRLEDGVATDVSLTGASSPSSPLHAAQALTKLSAQQPHEYNAESLYLPIETLELLIDDFFAYIHPLCPFPHEPSFREQWRLREDRKNPGFLALLASMIGALVASFPRKPRLHLKRQGRENVYPDHLSLVGRCQDICAAARGPGYLDKDDLNIYDAATSYFLGLMNVYTIRWRKGRLYFGECLTILRSLGLHKERDRVVLGSGEAYNPFNGLGTDKDSPQQQPENHINIEMARRIYWTMHVGAKSLEQLGGRFRELFIPPATRSDPYPALPVEVDDLRIYPSRVEPQPPGLAPMISGFNANVRVHTSYETLSTLELAWGSDTLIDWDRQQRVLHECLQTCKNSLANLPEELIVHPQNGLGLAESQSNGQADSRPVSMAGYSTTLPSEADNAPQIAEGRRRAQYEIQKANIYVSCLATRSYIVEKYWNLHAAQERSSSRGGSVYSTPSSSVAIVATGIDRSLPALPATISSEFIEQEMRSERQNIISDLFMVLGSINQVHMEPNAHSFTMKIRAIAGTLITQPDASSALSPLPAPAQDYLHAFLEILQKLERNTPATADVDTPISNDEEGELHAWADLREHQMEFARKGGLLGMS